ncbi:MAG: aminoacyl-tRNA hydrolase [Patescibacteria group bacterium]
MLLIVGLGNPGKEYEGTRHNAGFMFVEKMAGQPEIAPVEGPLNFRLEKKFSGLIAETEAKGEKIILLKPLTFMNLSGQAVQKVMDYYKILPKDLIVVSDDVDIPLGTARIRHEGSSGGQKGLQNIIDSVGTDQFTRIRIGINAIGGDADQTFEITNRPDTTQFVLSQFNKREADIIDNTMQEAVRYLIQYIGEKGEMPAHTIEVKIDSL